MNPDTLPQRWLGYVVCTHGNGDVVGEIDGVQARGVRLRDLPGHPGFHGYLPAEAIESADRRTRTATLRIGILPAAIVDAPAPADEGPDGWYTSAEWWAGLLTHYGLYTAPGRGGRPLLLVGGRHPTT